MRIIMKTPFLIMIGIVICEYRYALIFGKELHRLYDVRSISGRVDMSDIISIVHIIKLYLQTSG